MENRSAGDKKRLTFKFIKTYMQYLKKRYPNACSMDLINEITTDSAEIRGLKEEASLVDSNCDLKHFTLKYIKAFSERYKNESV